MKSDEYAAILARVDAAVVANLCGCGCGQQIPARGPSPDFVNEKHQQRWVEQRATPTRAASNWYRELASVVREDGNEVGHVDWSHVPAVQTRRGGIRFHVDGSDCPVPESCADCRANGWPVAAQDCDDDHCPCHNPAVTIDETHTMKLSTLRKAIDKIMGKSR